MSKPFTVVPITIGKPQRKTAAASTDPEAAKRRKRIEDILEASRLEREFDLDNLNFDTTDRYRKP